MAKTNPQAAPVRQRGRSRIVGTIVVLLLIVALAGLGWWLTHRPATSGAGPGGPGGAPPGAPGGFGGGRRGATTVGTTVARSTDIPVLLESLGTVTPLATVTVRPQVSGVITDIRFTEGQRVKRGEVLAVIDRRAYQIALDQAQAQLQRDQAELENARVVLQRYDTLQAQDSIAQQDVDTQKATVKQLDGTVAADRAAVGTARLNLDFSEVKSPIDGRVGLRVVDVGNYIGAGDATGLAVVTQLSPVDVVFTVPQDRVGEIQRSIGQGKSLPALALDRTRTDTLAQGAFLTLDNLVDTTTGTVRAKARFANADAALFPNQFVNLRLTLRTVENAVTLPVSAVRNGTDGDFVWLIGDNQTAKKQKVTRGQATNDFVQITDGVKVGDVVITEGGDRLQDGGKVTLPPQNGAAAPGADAAAKQGAPQNGTPGDGDRRREHRKRREGAPGGNGGGAPAGGPPPNAP